MVRATEAVMKTWEVGHVETNDMSVLFPVIYPMPSRCLPEGKGING